MRSSTPDVRPFPGRAGTINPILFLRLAYWAGAILDLAAGLMMVFPGLLAAMLHPVDFQPGPGYRYAMGMGAPLMFGWTVLLLWADRKPLERKGILPVTLLVVAGEVATQAWGIAAGFVPLAELIPTFAIQALLAALFLFAFFNAREAG
jgi:hypothetical protein